jgi:osmoprotectant transport system ATP-binding protein
VTGNWGELLGIVGIEEISEHLHHDSKIKIGDIVKNGTRALFENTPLSDVFELMQSQRILPVVDDQNRLIGTVTRSGVIEAIGRHFHREESSA